MKKKPLDPDEFRKHPVIRLEPGETLLGENGVLTPILKARLEKALEALRQGETVGVNLNPEIIALHAGGASNEDIQEYLADRYDADISLDLIRCITQQPTPTAPAPPPTVPRS